MDHRHVAIGAKNKLVNVGSLRNGCATIGISQPSQRDMPRDKYELEAESSQSLPNPANQFLHRWMAYCRINLPLHDLISTTISWHCPINQLVYEYLLEFTALWQFSCFVHQHIVRQICKSIGWFRIKWGPSITVYIELWGSTESSQSLAILKISIGLKESLISYIIIFLLGELL
jgi:hypothetical protein